MTFTHITTHDVVNIKIRERRQEGTQNYDTEIVATDQEGNLLTLTLFSTQPIEIVGALGSDPETRETY